MTSFGIGPSNALATTVWHRIDYVHEIYNVTMECRRYRDVKEFFLGPNALPEHDYMNLCVDVDLGVDFELDVEMWSLRQFARHLNAYGTQVYEAPDGTICVRDSGISAVHDPKSKRTSVFQNNNAVTDVLLRNAPTCVVVRWLRDRAFETLDIDACSALLPRRHMGGTVCCDAMSSGGNSAVALTIDGEMIDLCSQRLLRAFNGQDCYFQFMEDSEATMVAIDDDRASCTLYDSRMANHALHFKYLPVDSYHTSKVHRVVGGSDHVMLQFDNIDARFNAWSEVHLFDIRRGGQACGLAVVPLMGSTQSVFVNWRPRDPFHFSYTLQDGSSRVAYHETSFFS
jgi:hypothetical protein